MTDRMTEWRSAFDGLRAAMTGEPEWFAARREAGLETLAALGLPTRRNEEWRYTPLGDFGRATWTPASALVVESAVAAQVEALCAPEDAGRVVLVNGVLARGLCRLPAQGMELRSLDEALRDCPELVAELLGGPIEAPTGLDGLHAAFVRDAAVLLVDRNADVSGEGGARPVRVIHVSAPSVDRAMWFPTVLASVGPLARVAFVEHHIATSSSPAAVLPRLVVTAGPGSDVSHARVQSEGPASLVFGRTSFTLSRDTKLRTFTAALGAAVSREDLRIRLEAPGGEATLGAVSFATGQRAIDNHTVVDHQAPDCRSDQYYKAILDEEAHGIFNGKIFVRPGAQQTAAMQLHRALMLSRKARIDAKPQLEIFADDVRCTHGATIGQLDAEELFYLQARAIPADVARRMLVAGFAEDVLDRLPIPSLRASLTASLQALHS